MKAWNGYVADKFNASQNETTHRIHNRGKLNKKLGCVLYLSVGFGTGGNCKTAKFWFEKENN